MDQLKALWSAIPPKREETHRLPFSLRRLLFEERATDQEQSSEQLQGRQNERPREAHTHRQVDSPHIVPVTSYHVHAAVHSIALLQSTREIIVCMGVAHLCALERLAGHLSHFASNWEIVTKDRWVLNTVRGYRIQFASNPYQSRRPHPIRFNQSQGTLRKQKSRNFCSKG